MPTLLLQCVAPLQSWGTQSNFTVRDTGREPSKSGIIGLLCAALGRPRFESVADLASLTMGVRVDQEGQILRDYHTAGSAKLPRLPNEKKAKFGVAKASDGKPSSQIVVSNRYYLADAMFLVGLSGDSDLLQTVQNALANPHWMLFLGRKACPPARPIYLPDGWQEKSIDEALAQYPWLGRDKDKYDQLNPLRLVLEDEMGDDIKKDMPLSFEKGNRQFALRRSVTGFIEELPPYRKPLTKIEEATS